MPLQQQSFDDWYNNLAPISAPGNRRPAPRAPFERTADSSRQDSRAFDDFFESLPPIQKSTKTAQSTASTDLPAPKTPPLIHEAAVGAFSDKERATIRAQLKRIEATTDARLKAGEHPDKAFGQMMTDLTQLEMRYPVLERLELPAKAAQARVQARRQMERAPGQLRPVEYNFKETFAKSILDPFERIGRTSYKLMSGKPVSGKEAKDLALDLPLMVASLTNPELGSLKTLAATAATPARRAALRAAYRIARSAIPGAEAAAAFVPSEETDVATRARRGVEGAILGPAVDIPVGKAVNVFARRIEQRAAEQAGKKGLENVKRLLRRAKQAESTAAERAKFAEETERLVEKVRSRAKPELSAEEATRRLERAARQGAKERMTPERAIELAHIEGFRNRLAREVTGRKAAERTLGEEAARKAVKRLAHQVEEESPRGVSLKEMRKLTAGGEAATRRSLKVFREPTRTIEALEDLDRQIEEGLSRTRGREARPEVQRERLIERGIERLRRAAGGEQTEHMPLDEAVARVEQAVAEGEPGPAQKLIRGIRRFARGEEGSLGPQPRKRPVEIVGVQEGLPDQSIPDATLVNELTGERAGSTVVFNPAEHMIIDKARDVVPGMAASEVEQLIKLGRSEYSQLTGGAAPTATQLREHLRNLLQSETGALGPQPAKPTTTRKGYLQQLERIGRISERAANASEKDVRPEFRPAIRLEQAKSPGPLNRAIEERKAELLADYQQFIDESLDPTLSKTARQKLQRSARRVEKSLKAMQRRGPLPEVTEAGAERAETELKSALSIATKREPSVFSPGFKREVGPPAMRRAVSKAMSEEETVQALKKAFLENPDMRANEVLAKAFKDGDLLLEEFESVRQRYGWSPEELATYLYDTARGEASYYGRGLRIYSDLGKFRKALEGHPALRKNKELLDKISPPPPVWERGIRRFRQANDLIRIALVSQLATAVRNAESQGVTVALDGLERSIVGAAGKLTGKPELGALSGSFTRQMAALRESAADSFASVAHLMGLMKNRQQSQLLRLLAKYPKQLDTLLNRPIAEVTLSRNVTKWLLAFNTAQERIFRKAVMQARLEQGLKDLGKSSFDELSEPQLKKLIKSGLDDALRLTYAAEPGGMAGAMVKAHRVFPPLHYLGMMFPRFWANSWRWFVDHSPLTFASPKNIDIFLKGAPREKALQWSKFMTGSALGAAAFWLRSSDMAGEQWYEIKVPKGVPKYGGKIIDARPFAPFSLYLFFAELTLNPHRIRAKDAMEAVMSVNRRLALSRVGVEWFWDKVRGTTAEETVENLRREAQDLGSRMMGELLGMAATPMQTFRDVIGQFSREERVSRDVRAQPILGPAMQKFPFLTRALPERPSATRSKPYERVQPGLRQALGITALERNPVEQELARLGISYRQIMPRSEGPGFEKFDRNVTRVMGRLSDQVLEDYIQSPAYQRLDDDTKVMVLRDIMFKVFKEAGKAAAEGVQPGIILERFKKRLERGPKARVRR